MLTPSRLRPIALLGAAWLALGCGSEEIAPPPIIVGDSGCPAGEWPDGNGVCLPAGLPADMACPPGTWLREPEGTCEPAGVPSDGCGAGFYHDGNGGCEVMLPDDPCPAGLMAIPGETTCRPIAACEDGTWGGIPVEANTQYVDASYAGTNSDGSQAAPWTTIQEAVDAADPGAIVALAAGSYQEDVVVTGKPVRLWGRCPDMVELVATGNQLAALRVVSGAADGSEIRRMAITGPAIGVLLLASHDVAMHELWIHDMTDRGVNAEDDFGPAGFALNDSLVERTQEIAVFADGVKVSVERSVLRHTGPSSELAYGRGVVVQHGLLGPADAYLSQSVVSDNNQFGIYLAGSPMTVEDCVVRGTVADAINQIGYGMGAQAGATGVVRRSLFHRNQAVGVFVEGSDLAAEALVVRATRPDATGMFGRGLAVQLDPDTARRSTAALSHSLSSSNHSAGLFTSSADVVLDASLVRNTGLDEGPNTAGVHLQQSPGYFGSTALVTRSIIEDNRGTGLLDADSEVTVDATLIRGTMVDDQESRGRGLVIADLTEGATGAKAVVTRTALEGDQGGSIYLFGGEATVDSSVLRASGARAFGTQAGSLGTTARVLVTRTLVEQAMEGGFVLIGADATLQGVVVRDTRRNADILFGRGIHVQSDPSGIPAKAIVQGCLVEQSFEAGVSVVGATNFLIEGSIVRDSKANEVFLGDGLSAFSSQGTAVVSLRNTRFERSARAGVSSFGAAVELSSVRLACQGFDLDVESYEGQAGNIHDGGDVLCGCPEAKDPCRAQSLGLEPPSPVE